MHKLFAAALLASATTVLTSPAIADDHSVQTADNASAASYKTVREDIWQWQLDNSPGLATSVGDRRGDGKLGDWSVEAHSRSIVDARQFMARLDAIDRAELPADLQVDYDVVRVSMADIIAASVHEHDWYQIFTNRGGWFNQLASLPNGSPFFTSADYDSYVGRLEAYEKVNQDAMARTRIAIEKGLTHACGPMEGFH